MRHFSFIVCLLVASLVLGAPASNLRYGASSQSLSDRAFYSRSDHLAGPARGDPRYDQATLDRHVRFTLAAESEDDMQEQLRDEMNEESVRLPYPSVLTPAPIYQYYLFHWRVL